MSLPRQTSDTNIDVELQAIKQRIATLKSNGINQHKDSCNQEIGEIACAMVELFRQAAARKQLHIVLKEMIENINQWVITLKDLFFGSRETILLPGLSECACYNSDIFNRELNNRRANIEASIIDYIKSNFPDTEKKSINYMSLGCGNLLQDFIIIFKLMLLGYRNIHIHLVDPKITLYKIRGSGNISKALYEMIKNGELPYESPDQVSIEKSDAYHQFMCLKYCASEMHAAITITEYTSIDDYKGGELDLLTAIDFNDSSPNAFNDLMKAKRFIAEKGRIFLSFDKNDLMFSKYSAIESLGNFSSLVEHSILGRSETLQSSGKFSSLLQLSFLRKRETSDSEIVPITRGYQ